MEVGMIMVIKHRNRHARISLLCLFIMVIALSGVQFGLKSNV